MTQALLQGPVGREAEASSSVFFMTSAPCSTKAPIGPASSFGNRSVIHTSRVWSSALGKDLHRRVVVLESPSNHSVGDPTGFVVNVDDQLANYHTVGKGHDSSFLLQASIDDEAHGEPFVYRTNITDGFPDFLGESLNEDFFADGSHLYFSLISG